jgi:hypothetical protein
MNGINGRAHALFLIASRNVLSIRVRQPRHLVLKWQLTRLLLALQRLMDQHF